MPSNVEMLKLASQCHQCLDIEHFEMDSIVGGTVKDMMTALVKNYLDLPNRVEIIVIAGINNIAAGNQEPETQSAMLSNC